MMTGDISLAAQSLIVRLKAPAQYHSVWIRTDVEDGKFVPKLCVSIRPQHKNKIKIPETHEGFAVVNMPWPKDQ